MCCIVAGTAVYHLIKHGIIYFQSLAAVFAVTPRERDTVATLFTVTSEIAVDYYMNS